MQDIKFTDQLKKISLTLRESNVYKYYQEYDEPVKFEDFFKNEPELRSRGHTFRVKSLQSTPQKPKKMKEMEKEQQQQNSQKINGNLLKISKNRDKKLDKNEIIQNENLLEKKVEKEQVVQKICLKRKNSRHQSTSMQENNQEQTQKNEQKVQNNEQIRNDNKETSREPLKNIQGPPSLQWNNNNHHKCQKTQFSYKQYKKALKNIEQLKLLYSSKIESKYYSKDEKNQDQKPPKSKKIVEFTEFRKRLDPIQQRQMQKSEDVEKYLVSENIQQNRSIINSLAQTAHVNLNEQDNFKIQSNKLQPKRAKSVNCRNEDLSSSKLISNDSEQSNQLLKNEIYRCKQQNNTDSSLLRKLQQMGQNQQYNFNWRYNPPIMDKPNLSANNSRKSLKIQRNLRSHRKVKSQMEAQKTQDLDEQNFNFQIPTDSQIEDLGKTYGKTTVFDAVKINALDYSSLFKKSISDLNQQSIYEIMQKT